MADQHQGGTGNVVGRIAGKEGYVYLVESDGTRHLVETGEAVRIGQTVETLGSSAVVITFTGSKSVSLGQNQELTLDRRLIKLLEEINEEGSLDEAVNFDLIAQALESGQSIDELLPAPAAGGENSPPSSSSAGASAARIERTAAEVTPESGFETAALVSDANNLVAPDTNEAIAESLITPAGNSQPVTIGINDFTINEDEQYTLDLNQFFSDTDPGQSLAFSVDNLPEGLVLDPVTGIISGVPTNDSALLNNGTYSITVTATDNSGAANGSATASFNLSVNNVNDNPSVGSVVNLGTIGEDSTITIPVSSLLAGVQDIDGDNLNVTSVTLEAGEGALTVNDSGDYVYTPSGNWSGEAVFGYVIGDGHGGQITNTATLTVNAVNDAPVAVNDGLIGMEVNGSITLDVLANDYDVDGDTLVITGVSARQGTVIINPEGTVTYTPNQDFIGRDVLSYTISDGNGGEAGSLALVNIVVGNVAPVMADDASVTVPENTLQVGNFAASDADGDTVTYSLSGSDADFFTIDSSGNLSFVSAPDFESNPGPFSVTILATDDGVGNLSASQTLIVSVSDTPENTAPVLGADTHVDVTENSTMVGNFTATDAEGDNITYSLGGADAALFSIDVAGNLSFVAGPNFETNSGPFYVTVIATDDGEGTLFDSQNVTVNVTNVVENSAPVLGAGTSIDVAENTTTVGNFAAGDAEGDNISYTLSGTDAVLFSIDMAGNLSFISAPDFEANPGPFSVTVIATDDGENTLFDTQNITVNVTNVVENTAPVLGNDTSVDVSENATTVGNFAATDAEGDNTTYTLGGTDAALFSIDADGNLSFIAAPDFESNPGPFNITVTATDDGEGAFFDTQNITVNVTNTIENTAPLLGTDVSVNVAENTATVGNFAAIDSEADDITYSLSGTDATLFSIDAAGNLSFILTPDFESNPGPFNVIVTATDDGEGALFDTQNIVVNITNVIENTAPVLGADTSIDVAENTTAVGNFSATDSEGNNITYTLTGTDAALFSIDTAGNLSFVTAPDFEVNPGPFSVTVTATDDGEGSLLDTQNITINITNLVENSAPVLGTDVSVDVIENITVIGNFAASDVESDNITYTLSGSDAGLFNIDDSGNLSFQFAPDFESNSGPFNVTITATDDGEGTLFDNQNVTVNVTNVIENTAPGVGSDTFIDVAENTITVGNFAATDAEGDNIAYTLSGTDAALFSIDTAGNLSFVAAPDFETSPGPFNVTVIATDDGEGTLFDTQSITVSVTNSMENTSPLLGADISVSVAENTITVGNFAATDAEGNNITYTISGVDAGLFTVDSSGNLSFLTAPDFEINPGPFTVTVTATDDGEGALFDTQNISVNLTNVMENTAPVLGTDASVDVTENTTAVGNFAAIDAEDDNVIYTLSGTDAALFSIDTAGNLSFIAAPDFEFDPGPFSVTISATDDGEGTLFDSQNVTVNVTNVIENTTPVLGADASVDVTENTTAVGNFAAIDTEGDNVTYTLSGTDAALFSIDMAGNLSFIAAPDFESNPGPFSVTVTATDDGEGALFDTQNVTVNLANVIENTAPVLGADTSVDIAENTTAVGNFAATDAEGDNVIYALSGADAGLFTIDSAGNLAFLVAPDFEANAGPFNVTITATDDGEGALFDTQNIAISVTNVIENTAPVLGADASVDVAENTTTVGNFAATDAEGNSIAYALSGADAGLFTIDNSGNLSFLATPDFETSPGPFNVIITATDDGEGALFDTQNVTINITNVIENSAPVLGADTSVSIAENTTTIGNFAAIDAEGDSITYTLGGIDAALFSIDASGNLSFIAAPDFETNPGPFSVTVTATDDGEGALFDAQNITVDVTNTTENTAPVLGADTSADVAENTTDVGNFSATDAEGDNITYTLSGTDAALFNVDASGNLSFISAPDFEASPGPFNVTITATDDGEGALFDVQNVTVNITNTIENNAPVLGVDTAIDVAENTTTVGNFAATDVEGHNITYTLSGAAAGLFSVDTAGNLSFIFAPDFETNAGPFNVTITATDDGEGALFDTQNVTVNVTNIIENTAPVLGADTSIDVSENTAVVGNFAATDAEGDGVTYALSGADAGLFSIDAAGNLSFITAPDFETNAGPFSVTITATDEGEGSLFDTQNIIVNVTNLIENAAPVLGADTSADVAENATAVGNFAATDAEGDNIDYTLSGADAGLFSIDNSGNLSFLVAPDFEVNNGPFDVTIIATDDGEGTLFDTQDITVNVTNTVENTAPVLGVDTAVDVAENTTTVGNFAATDAEGDNITYTLSGADAGLFSIDAAGNLSFITAPDFEANPGPFSVTVAATDDGEGALFDTQNVTVNITNVIENTAPVLGADSSVDIAENTTAVGNFSATEAEGDNVTYTLSGADAGLFSIDAAGNLSFITAPDFEANPGPFSLTVTATDDGEDALFDTQNVTVNITNVIENTAPVLGADTSIDIAENATAIGNFAATDTEGDNITYALSGVDAGLFTIDSAGNLAFLVAPDFETNAGPFNVTITATDDGEGTLFDTQSVAVSVTNVIENTAPVLGVDASVDVAENTTVVGNFAATDAEGDNVIYTLSGADAALFSIDASGNLSFVSAPDFETDAGPFNVTATATDDGEDTLFDTQNIAVNVTNVIENTAPVLGADTSFDVAENTTAVGNFIAKDAEGNNITYSLSGTDAALFSIDAAGNLSFVSAPDFEANPGPFNVTITAADDGEGTLFDTQNITVNVTNVIENTAPALGADTSVSVAENTMMVGSFAATDAEGDNVIYALSGADAGLFGIDSAGNLSFLAAPDFETNPGPFNVIITATDDGEGALFDIQNVTVNVTNVIENTAPALGVDVSVDVAENTVAVGSFAATDGEGDNITYALSGADVALFNIDAAGNLSFVAAPDFEANSGPFSVTITATDDGEGTLLDTQNVTVNITNIIENSAPSLGADASVSVAENTVAVGNFSATDVEGDNITYTLSGADAGLFAIDSAGNLFFLVAPDFETNAGPFNVTVTATDDGDGALFDTQNITINVTNVIENTAPVLGADSSVDVAENTTAIGNFSSTDAEGDNIVYTLNGTDAALFNIDAAGNLNFVAAPDYEANPGPFNVTVTATDDGEGTLFDTQNVTVNVTNIIENTAPSLGVDTSVDVAENTTTVGNFAATDAEANNVTYALSGADAGLFAIDNSGNLSFLAAPDFETNAGPFNVTITATDDGEGELFDTQNITVNVTNVIENIAPVLGTDVSVDVAENTTAVGNFAATDVDGDNITYTLSGADAGLFSVDSVGNLSFLAAPDFETNAGPFNVTITATDDGEGALFDTQNVTVNVTNIIENTAPVLGADTSVDVAENTTAVGNFAATDAEGNNITYSLSGADAALFNINAAGNLSFVAALDFESNPGPFSVTIAATDDGEGALFDTQNVTVNVTNVIENTAPVLGADTSVDIAENTTAVGNFAATDVDDDTITYTLSGADAGLFSVDSAGNLSFLAAPNFETNTGPFNVTIIATDDGEGALSDTQNITVNVTNIIENTAPVLGADVSVDVAENTTAVGNFTAMDAESDNISYALSGPDAGLFSIDSSGNLSFLMAPDFETNSGPFNVTVTATDDGEGTLSDTQSITVNITNIIENTSPVLGADVSVDIVENTTAVGNFAGSDAEGNSITYTLSGLDAGLFTIDSSGNLFFLTAPDFETNAGPFNVTITATDDGEGALFDTQSLTVNVTNVIENTAPSLGSDTSIDVAENTTVVGNFAATDVDGDNITYTLSGADAALFTIDSNGNLSFLASPDFETNPGPFSVTITATDDGEGALIDAQNVTINITNLIENTAPVLGADVSVDVAENTTAVGNFASTDVESNNITYTLSGADAGLFSIDATGNLSFLAAPDFETNAGPFNVTITATDDGEGALFDTQNVTITVTNVTENTAPVLGADTSIDVAETTTVVGNFAATDAEGDSVTYTLSGIDAALFNIDAAGNLSFITAPDFETNPGPFSVTITTTDDGEGALFDIQNVTVNVTNVIENTDPVLGADTSVDIAENTTTVGDFAATDVDGDNITYSLSGTDAGLFSVDSAGNLSFLAAPDFETNAGPFNVTITATDDGEGNLFDSQNVSVNVTNVIENTAPVLGSDVSVDVAENAMAVGNFAATDAEGDSITYSLSGADAALFTVDTSGNLSFVSAPDFETNPGSFNLTIVATDDGEGALVDAQNITVSVTNEIENTSPVLGADASVNVAENTTVVGNFAATDAEADNITYSLSGSNAGLFTIDSSGNLSFLVAPDFETNPGPFSVTITATDDGEGALFDTQNVTVNLANVIENTAPVLGADTSVDIAENTTAVGNFAATDAEGDNVIYALSGADAGLFTIDSAGNLAFLVAPDFEANAGPFNVTITATDDGEGTLFDTQNIAISVTNVIENTAPVLGADASVDVAENTNTVGNFAATDAEGNSVTYALSGADAGLFTIDNSGNLTFLATPDFETSPGPFNVIITATDDGEGALSATQNVTVNVTDVNEPALIDLDANNSTAPNSDFQTTYTEGGSAVRVADIDTSITDVDSTQLQSATLTITNVETGDLLSAGTLPTGIAASAYNPATGTITLSGTASLTAYQAAIRAIQFSNDGSASGSSRNIEVTVNDGDDNSNVATTTINMVLVPTISITDVSVQEPSSGTTMLVFTVSLDQTLASDLTFSYDTVDVSATAGADYISVSGGAGTIVAGATSTTIAITINSDANNFEGDEAFTVNLTGFNQTVNFPAGSHVISGGVQGVGTIGANNGAPDAVNDSFITSEDTPLITGNVFGNDSLVDNADYSSHDANSTQGGTVTYNDDGTFTYTPATGFSGTDSFTYTIIDDDGETDTATVTVEVTNVPVNPPLVNSVPDTVYTENDFAQGLLSGISLSDIDSATLSSVVVRIDGYIASQDVLGYLTAGTSVNASAAVSGNTWELTLTNGADINEYLSVLGSLTYQNSSENPSTANRTITVEAYDQDYNNLFGSDSGTITVIAENDAPTVTNNDSFYVSNSTNNSLNITGPFDVDTDDSTLVITVTGLPTSVGTVTLADGTPVNIGNNLTLTQLASLQLDAGVVDGTDIFTYTVFDGELTTVGTTTVNVGDSEPDSNTVYESALDDGTGVDAGSIVATGNLFANDAAADGSTTLNSIEYNSTSYAPVSGVITIGTALGTLTVYADNSTPGFSVGDYEYVLNSADGSGADVSEVFTYNFTSGVSIQDTLTIAVVDDQPVANDLVEDIPESEERIFNLIFTLDDSGSMAFGAVTGSSPPQAGEPSRMDLAKQALQALAEEYFNQSTQVTLTLITFNSSASFVGTYNNYADFVTGLNTVTPGGGTDYLDATTEIENQFSQDLLLQDPADDVQNISYFISDGESGSSPIGSGFREFVDENSISSYSVGIGSSLPSDLSDLNYIHNIDSMGQGNGHVDNALIVPDVSQLESELLSTVPTAFGGNITVDGSIANVQFGADNGFVSSISLELGGTPYTFTYDGSDITVPGALTNIDMDGARITFNADDGFVFGTFTFDFSDGSYLFVAPNGSAGSTFNFDFTVVDGDGDSASATATINIVDDKPDARDDLHTINVFETAQGNVVTGIGTDGGPKLGSGFTEFASQGGGVDKVVDNATVSEFTLRGTTISLDLTPVAQVTGVSANISPTSQTIINASDFSISATRLGSPANLGFDTGGGDAGVGIQGDTNDEIDSNEVMTITWDSSSLPNGIQNLILELGSNFQNADTAQVRLYDINGIEMTGSPLSQNGTNDTLDLSSFTGVGSIEMTSTGGNGFTLNNIAYDPVPSVPVETSGANGPLSWTYQVDFDLDGNQVNQATVVDSSDGSVFIMRSNGYYEYTPEALVIPPGTPVSESFTDGSADQGIIPTTTDNGSPSITFIQDINGVVTMGVSSTGDQYSDSADRGDNIILTFDSGLYPNGVQEIEMEFGYHLGAGSAIFYDEQGNVIDTVTLTQSATQTFSGISGVRSVEISTGFSGDYSIRQVNFEIAPDLTTLSNTNEPVLVDYVLTDSDGQSDTAQLAIHTTDNQITGTVGADSISGGSLNDAIFGDDGDDILSGGAGHDTISGGEGADIISGNADSDYLSGGDDKDELYGGTGNDHLSGDAGNDLLDGGLGDDIVLGGDGSDLIFGGAGSDRLEGGAGDDIVYGGAGNDILFGDDGDDIIFGGTGDDTLTGGDNIDTFIWQVTDAGSIDTVTDFENGLYGDVLDFSDLLQGESADAAILDSYFTITSDGNDTTLEIDIDGDGSGVDMTVVLRGVDLTLLGSEQQILQQLLDDGNLATD